MRNLPELNLGCIYLYSQHSKNLHGKVLIDFRLLSSLIRKEMDEEEQISFAFQE